jgi:hypothetical protein
VWKGHITIMEMGRKPHSKIKKYKRKNFLVKSFLRYHSKKELSNRAAKKIVGILRDRYKHIKG